jgi:hypothetical protein
MRCRVVLWVADGTCRVQFPVGLDYNDCNDHMLEYLGLQGNLGNCSKVMCYTP